MRVFFEIYDQAPLRRGVGCGGRNTPSSQAPYESRQLHWWGLGTPTNTVFPTPYPQHPIPDLRTEASLDNNSLNYS